MRPAVPTMAEAILKATQAGTYKGAALRGIAVGNGCTGTEIGVCGGERDKYEAQYFVGTAFVKPALKVPRSGGWPDFRTPRRL